MLFDNTLMTQTPDTEPAIQVAGNGGAVVADSPQWIMNPEPN
jgi:hypothetical protein